ncbi:hypothetical protein VIGAN_10163500 [Vigna angularis var. angularis]|uniref:Uncharacterized protein n=1 Tax=Vigna angularis var. angularis TaxID=157739 RepID=A0A0S3T4E3_PHAAN|nr:hypothetical protein VIGAN_10163500 [Vigna angularis var. angularis]
MLYDTDNKLTFLGSWISPTIRFPFSTCSSFASHFTFCSFFSSFSYSYSTFFLLSNLTNLCQRRSRQQQNHWTNPIPIHLAKSSPNNRFKLKTRKKNKKIPNPQVRERQTFQLYLVAFEEEWNFIRSQSLF